MRYPVNDAIQPNMVPAVVIFVGKYLYVYHLRGPDAPDQSVSYGFDRKESEGAEIDGKEQKKESRGRLIHCPGVQSIHNDAGKNNQFEKNVSIYSVQKKYIEFGRQETRWSPSCWRRDSTQQGPMLHKGQVARR